MAAGVVVLAVVEPNLSGVWTDRDGYEVRIRQVGNTVRAEFARGGESFTARFVADRQLEGEVNLFWQDDTDCDNGFASRRGFSADVGSGFETLVMQYKARRGRNCIPTGEDRSYTVRLYRKPF